MACAVQIPAAMRTLLLALALALVLVTSCTDPDPDVAEPVGAALTAEPTLVSAEPAPGDADKPAYDDHCALAGEVEPGGFFQDKTACEKRSGEIKDGKATCKTGDKLGTECRWNKNTGPGDTGVCVCYVASEPAPAPTDTEVEAAPIEPTGAL